MNTRARLIEAIDNGETLSVVYHGGTQPGTARCLLPVGIIGNHLRALAPPDEQIHTYHVDKMEVVAPGHPVPAYDSTESPSETASSHAPRAPVPARAVPGSYDDAYFIDPLTKAFHFPEFNSPEGALVSVRDCTRHDRTTFSSLERTAPRDYGIERFEDDFAAARFEVDDIGCLFHGANLQHFEPFPYLVKAKAQVDALVACLEDRRRIPYVVIDNKIYTLLEGDGFARTVALGRNRAVQRWRDRFREDELVRLASNAGLDAQGGKEILITRLARSGVLSPPAAVQPTLRFDSLVVALADVYIAEIRRISDRFHPLCIPYVWKAAAAANRGGWSYLASRIQDVQEENYWLARFEPGPPPDPGESMNKRWWMRR